MDKITEDIIKLVQLRYPFAKIIYTSKGNLLIEAYHPNLFESEKQSEADGSEEPQYLNIAKDYMYALQLLAVTQPDDLGRLVAAIENNLQQTISELYKRGKVQWEQSLSINQPYVMADANVYKFWVQLGAWDEHEAALLLLGRNPDIVTLELIEEPDVGPLGEYEEQTDFSREYHRLLRIVHRQVDAGHISVPIEPIQLVAWAQKNKMTVPDGLIEAVVDGATRTLSCTGASKKDLPTDEVQEPQTEHEQWRRQRQRRQEGVIIAWLTSNGFDPKSLPRPPQRGAAGPAAAAFGELKSDRELFRNRNVFDKAWRRLVDFNDISFREES